MTARCTLKTRESESAKTTFRVYLKRHTGLNGRLDQRATGIGLYLAETTADKLNISISVQSQSGVGSKFALSFPPNERKMFD